MQSYLKGDLEEQAIRIMDAYNARTVWATNDGNFFLGKNLAKNHKKEIKGELYEYTRDEKAGEADKNEALKVIGDLSDSGASVKEIKEFLKSVGYTEDLINDLTDVTNTHASD